MIKYTLLLLSLSLFSFAQVVLGQQNSTGSVYSSYGMGTMYQPSDPTSIGFGIDGVAFSNQASANMTNPALWGFYRQTTGSGGVLVSQFTGTSENETSTYSELTSTQFGFIFPILRNQLGVGFSLSPVSRQAYSFNSFSSIPGDTLLVSNNVSGRGGLSALELGIGYRVNASISVGYSPALVFGNLTRSELTLFESALYATNRYEISRGHIGYRHKLGFHFQQFDLLKNEDRLSLGLMITLPYTLTQRNELRSFVLEGGIEQFESNELERGEVKMPASFQAGISYNSSPYMNWNFEALYQPWSSFQLGDGSTPEYSSDRIKLGGGIFIQPDIRRAKNLFGRLGYKLGFTYDSGNLTLFDTKISTYAVNTGLKIPSLRSGSSVDVNLKYGIIGSQTVDLVREQFLQLSVSFNLSELMFFQRKIQ